MNDRVLIVNADDFGLSDGTNEGILRAHEHGIVTSASLMVLGRASAGAARYAREHPALAVGLHFDLAEWVYEDGDWVMRYERGPAEAELPRQLELFRELMGADPTHLDSHQHVHESEPAATLLGSLADELGVPLRKRGAIRYCGEFYGQTGKGEPVPDAIEPEALVAIVEGLEPGVTELACHPGLDLELDSPYRLERPREVDALCDGRVQEALRRAGVRLASFAELS